MSAKTRDMLWAFSLMAIGLCTLVLSGSSILGLELPVLLTRVLGILELIALPVLGFTTVRKLLDKRSAEK